MLTSLKSLPLTFHEQRTTNNGSAAHPLGFHAGTWNLASNIENGNYDFNVIRQQKEAMVLRIVEHPILTFTKGRRVRFWFDGREVYGHEGEPIAAALHAEGVRVLSHSENLHRPRGFFCAIGTCSSCIMKVNGQPNVRVCIEKLQEDMVVETQHGKGDIREKL
jgi:hypothetical protein